MDFHSRLARATEVQTLVTPRTGGPSSTGDLTADICKGLLAVTTDGISIINLHVLLLASSTKPTPDQQH